MIRSWASSQAQLDRIEEELTPPPGYRDPDTGRPAGFGSDEDAWRTFIT